MKRIKSKLDESPYSVKHIRAIAKAKKRSGKFALYSDQLGKRIYVTNIEFGEPAPLTFDKTKAIEFYEGFDNPEYKISQYEAALKQVTQFNIKLQSVQTKRPKSGTKQRE